MKRTNVHSTCVPCSVPDLFLPQELAQVRLGSSAGGSGHGAPARCGPQLDPSWDSPRFEACPEWPGPPKTARLQRVPHGNLGKQSQSTTRMDRSIGKSQKITGK